MRWLSITLFGLAGAVASDSVPAVQTDLSVTFTQHVAPLFRDHCVSCHRSGGVGPFSLTSWQEANSKAATIREVVTHGRMPPWHADPHFGRFSNDRRLLDEEIAVIAAWVDAGAQRGDGNDRISPKSQPGWRIGRPDLVLSMPETAQVPAAEVLPYQYYETPTGLSSDRWVSAIEARPGNGAVVHHILVYVRDPDLSFEEQRALGLGGGMIAGYAPGNVPLTFKPDTAMLLPANATLLWQLHYTPTGKAETDRSQLGIKFASRPPQYEHRTATALNTRFAIPPGTSNHRVQSQYTFPADAWMTSLTPHMHLRGKSFIYEARYPNGQRETLLSVPRYDFNWQTTYILDAPKPMPAGTQIKCTAHYDNSTSNPFNPDPGSRVTWGDQTWDEMMIGWFTFVWEPVGGRD